MLSEDALWNISLMFLCYAYIVSMVFVSGRLSGLLSISVRMSRKILHMLIGNLPFIIPFFTSSFFPVAVAAPFILVTFCVSPYSPFRDLSKRLSGLAALTKEGHGLGLTFYSISYTSLALFFASKPHIIAAGILPMAYGDSAASIIGERFGKMKFKFLSYKSLEGSVAMFLASFLSLSVGMVIFSSLLNMQVYDWLAILTTALSATLVELLSPHGSDDLFVPLASALTFLVVSGEV
ncbi:MAG: SEC59/DGK1/VTE5 family protein [Candidatus Bathyarchaeia archaeon]